MTPISKVVDFLLEEDNDNARLMAHCLQEEAQRAEISYVEDFIKLLETQERHRTAGTYKKLLARM